MAPQTPSTRLDLQLLLAHAGGGGPALAHGLSTGSAFGMDAPGDLRPEGRMRHDGADPNALPLQRWGVVAPRGTEGDRLLALVDPLIQLRREGQGGRPVVEERVPPDMTGEAARAWRSSFLRAKAVEDQPRYWLVLGDLDRVSFDLQQTLSVDCFTGRLAFREEDGYAAYAEKVRRHERAAQAAEARVLFCTVDDGTEATSRGASALMRPLQAECAVQRELGSFAGSIGELSAEPRDDLLELVGAGGPAVLVSLSHGAGAPRRGWASSEQQRALQGAMCLHGDASIIGDDVAQRSFLPGGVWLFMACFSAGTPARSAYHAWLRRLRDHGALEGSVDVVLKSLPAEGTPPFVAALPQAALANPEGPLAVIGHVDLAFTYAFQDPGGPRHARRFYGILRALADGARVGVAQSEITRFLIDTSIELSSHYDEGRGGDLRSVDPEERDIRKAQLWMRRHDLGGYLLLGDPAVRLPIARGGPRMVAVAGAVPVARMERAVHAVIAGAPLAEVAATAGVTRDEVEAWVAAYTEAGRASLARMAR